MVLMSTMSNRATLKVNRDTRTRLKVFAAKNEMDYDDAINHLLDEVDG